MMDDGLNEFLPGGIVKSFRCHRRAPIARGEVREPEHVMVVVVMVGGGEGEKA